MSRVLASKVTIIFSSWSRRVGLFPKPPVPPCHRATVNGSGRNGRTGTVKRDLIWGFFFFFWLRKNVIFTMIMVKKIERISCFVLTPCRTTSTPAANSNRTTIGRRVSLRRSYLFYDPARRPFRGKSTRAVWPNGIPNRKPLSASDGVSYVIADA